jgi:hypothetical protein
VCRARCRGASRGRQRFRAWAAGAGRRRSGRARVGGAAVVAVRCEYSAPGRWPRGIRRSPAPVSARSKLQSSTTGHCGVFRRASSSAALMSGVAGAWCCRLGG